LLSKKELQAPCFYISDYFERNRQEYYDRLQNVRLNNDMIGWIKFFLRASIETARSARVKFKGAVDQVNFYRDYLMKKRGSTESLGKVLRAMYKEPVISVNELCSLCELSVQTINTCVKTLQNDHIIEEITGKRRNRIFILRDYIRVFE